MNIKALNGFKDILPGEVELWQRLEAVARDIFVRFNFSEIRLPILEKTDLFARAIGESTDIVEKEMFTLESRSEEDGKTALRPEFTAGTVRAYLQNGMRSKPQPSISTWTSWSRVGSLSHSSDPTGATS